MVDEQLLDMAIQRSGFTIKHLVKTLGMSRTAFDKKRKGLIPFRVPEIYVLSDMLGLSESEKIDIFYVEESK